MATFSHISGDRILDLINTVEWRLGGPEREEDLTSYERVLTWCAEADLLTPREQAQLRTLASGDPRRAAAELAAVIAIREHAYTALFEASADAAEHIAVAYREAIAAARLIPQAAGWSWRDDQLTLASPRHRIARGLIELLGRDDLDRLHQCEDAICGWVYLDTSPRRNRRWCATSDCGDRNRSRAYYARQQARKRAGEPSGAATRA